MMRKLLERVGVVCLLVLACASYTVFKPPLATARVLAAGDDWAGADVVIIIDQSDSESTTDRSGVRFDAAEQIVSIVAADKPASGRGKSHRASMIMFGTDKISYDRTPNGWADMSKEDDSGRSDLVDWMRQHASPS